MEFKDLISTRRAKINKTMEEVAKVVGVSKATVQRWESGAIKNIRRDKIVKLAEALETTPAYLMGWEDTKHTEVKVQPVKYPKNMLPVDMDMVSIPILGTVSAGLGCLADNEIVGYEPWSASSIKHGHQYMCLKVDGDSMYPILIENDLVLVQCQSTVDSGSIAILTVNGDEGVIKKVVYGRDWIELHSVNPMYKTRRFEGEDVELINVMGLVVESKRKF